MPFYSDMEKFGAAVTASWRRCGGRGRKGKNRERKWVTLAAPSLGNPAQSYCGHSNSAAAFFLLLLLAFPALLGAYQPAVCDPVKGRKQAGVWLSLCRKPPTR